MTHKEMRQIRIEMRLNLRELSRVMKRKYRTLQNYEGDKREIPREFADALKAEQVRHNRIRAEVYAGIDADIARSYPHGIRSEVEDE